MTLRQDRFVNGLERKDLPFLMIHQLDLLVNHVDQRLRLVVSVKNVRTRW